MQVDDNGTGSQPTDQSVLSAFESLLSEDPEYKETDEAQPTQKSPESEPDPDEVEASTEQAQSEDGESETTEETDEETQEAPLATLDPNLRVKVKVDGEEQEITLGEALRGYSRTSDYTRKTQELAAQRKAAEEHISAVRGERERLAANLTELEQALKDATPQEPDWVRLQQESPEEFPVEWARWSQYKERMAALKSERDKAVEAVQRDRTDALRAQIASENEKLIAAIPAWKDPAKAKAEKAKIVAFAQDMGFTSEELGQLRDHRAIVLLRDAMKYRNMQKIKPAIEARIEKVKAATPGPGGANRQPKSKGKLAFERLAKSGSQEDLAAVFEQTVLADIK